jgi:hypothetical protein
VDLPIARKKSGCAMKVVEPLMRAKDCTIALRSINSSLRSTKRRRVLDDDGWSQHSPKDKMRQGADPVELGICSESEGRSCLTGGWVYPA